jgi:hypothetical protein
MPYIKPEDRFRALSEPQNAGELNYCLTMTSWKYLQTKGECYQTYNDIFACLHCAEFVYDEMTERHDNPKTPGDLRETIAHILVKFTGTQARKGLSARFDIRGAVECCKMELYRRLTAPYEDLKITQNTDVFPKEGK